MKRHVIHIAGFDVEAFEAGEGPPLLYLHGAEGFAPDHAYVAPLAKRRRLIAPSHPGFGRSELPDWMDSVADMAHVYLELIDHFALDRFDLIGCSLGGWIAADLGAKIPERLRKVVLAAPIGVKVGPTDALDIPDAFAMSQDELAGLQFHDPRKAKIDLSVLSEEQLAIMVRNRETFALVSWEPYMHDPKLKHRLHRLLAPTLFLRGESDRFVSETYLARYAKLLPDARIETIAEAGHALPFEQPEAFAAKALSFLDAAVPLYILHGATAP